MPALDPAGAVWRRSSSSGSGGNSGCVEVAFLPGGQVAVRDTEERTLPPHRHSIPAWRDLLAAVRAGGFEA